MTATPNEMIIKPTINEGVDLKCVDLNIILVNQGTHQECQTLLVRISFMLCN